MRRNEVLRILGDHRLEIERRFGVKRLRVFGSVARDETTETSDIDILVDFDGRPDFDRFMDLKFYLEDLLSARVDLVTRSGLRARLRPAIEQSAIDVA